MPRITVKAPAPEIVARDAQDAMLIRMGCPLIAFGPTGRPMYDRTGAVQMRRPSHLAMTLSAETLVGIGDVYLRRVGPESLKLALGKMGNPAKAKLLMKHFDLAHYFPWMPQDGKVSLAHSTGDYPNLLADTLNKAVLTHYATARRSWRAWAKRGTVKDLKQADRVRLDDAPALERLDPGAEIEFGSLPENPREQFTIGSYARGLAFTREAMINDDVQALRSVGEILAGGAYRLEDVVAYSVLTANANMADGNPLFSTAHANTSTGALTAASLGAACSKIATRTNANGDVLDLQPAVLVVPTTLKATAETILDSTANAGRHESETPIRMVSTAHLDVDSVTQFYVTTDPATLAAVEVAFLAGADGPVVDQKSSFSSDGIKFKVRHDLTAAAIDYRGIVRGSGA